MRFHQFSMKQLLISVLGISVGFGGIAFWMQPMVLPLDRSYDTLATFLPIVKLFALCTGVVMLFLSTIPLVMWGLNKGAAGRYIGGFDSKLAAMRNLRAG